MPFSIHVKRLLFPRIFPSFSPFPPPVFPAFAHTTNQNLRTNQKIP